MKKNWGEARLALGEIQQKGLVVKQAKVGSSFKVEAEMEKKDSYS